MTVDDIAKLLFTLLTLYKQLTGESMPNKVLTHNFCNITTLDGSSSSNQLTLDSIGNYLKAEIEEVQAIIDKVNELNTPF